MSNKETLKKPLISIITVVLNDEDNIEKTILSVLNQNYKNIEYIIIDGASKDKTLKIIEKYRDKISCLHSKKDQGIYDAFNIGLNKANGDLIGFVNSGDLLTEKSLEYLVDYYQKYDECDFFFGSVKKCKDLNPPSLPKPDCFIPPNGIRKSLKSHVLIHTTPASILAATL